MTLVGRSDALYGNQTKEGWLPLGYVIGLVSPTLRGPRRVIRGSSEFARKLAGSNLGGEALASGATEAHMALLRELVSPIAELPPSMAGSEDCQSLVAHLRNKKTITEEARRDTFSEFGMPWIVFIGYPALRTQRMVSPK